MSEPRKTKRSVPAMRILPWKKLNAHRAKMTRRLYSGNEGADQLRSRDTKG